jgi:hypothetical protein
LPAVPRLRRVREFLVATLERPLLFAFWTFVLWGTLLIVVFGVRVASEGFRDAVRSLWPDRAEGLAYANLAAAAVATLVWLAVATMAVLNRRGRT